MSISRRSRRAAEAWARASTARSPQGELLRRLGIAQRAAALKASVPPANDRRRSRRTDAADRRKSHRHGPLFKAIAVSQSGPRPLPGFDASEPTQGVECRTNGRSRRCGEHQRPLTLAALAGIRHAFFTRDGGVSDGLYASLNGGAGSEDAPAKVAENRARMAATLGVRPERLAHRLSDPFADVVVVERPWSADERPRADAIVTRIAGLAIGITTADCGPVLFADAAAGVIGAAHAGWRGALTGVLEATIAAMEGCGADRTRMAAALGPMIRQPNYEVGPESDRDPLHGRRPGQRAFLRARRRGRATPCSIFPAISPRASRAPASRGGRSRPLHLWRSDAVLQLSPRRPIATSPTTGGTSTRSRSANLHRVRHRGWTAAAKRIFHPAGHSAGAQAAERAEPAGKSMRMGLGLPGARAKAAALAAASAASRAAVGIGVAACAAAVRSQTSARPRAPSIAFESIDGPPAAVVPRLASALKEEAGARHIAVVRAGRGQLPVARLLRRASDGRSGATSARPRQLRWPGPSTSTTATRIASFA